MSRTAGTMVAVLVILLAIAGNTYISLRDHAATTGFILAESVQRVTTVGERCETTAHEAAILRYLAPPQQDEAAWFSESYARCLKSLAKVEARAHVKYAP